jgi:mRNA interferase HigB
MRIIKESSLKGFWTKHPDAEPALREWCAVARQASWEKPLDVRAKYPEGSSIGDGRFVFRFDDYRLVTWIAYEYYTVYIKWIGPHDDYDDIDPETVDQFS